MVFKQRRMIYRLLMHYVHIVWQIVVFTLMPKIHLVDVLLKYIHVKNVKNVDIELMLFYIVQQLMQNAHTKIVI